MSLRRLARAIRYPRRESASGSSSERPPQPGRIDTDYLSDGTVNSYITTLYPCKCGLSIEECTFYGAGHALVPVTYKLEGSSLSAARQAMNWQASPGIPEDPLPTQYSIPNVEVFLTKLRGTEVAEEIIRGLTSDYRDSSCTSARQASLPEIGEYVSAPQSSSDEVLPIYTPAERQPAESEGDAPPQYQNYTG